MTRRRQKQKRRSRAALWLLLLAALALWVLWGNTALVTTRAPFESTALPPAFDGFRILQVSDLHDARIGEENARLIEAARAAQPDIIVLTGDMIDSNRFDPELSLRTIEGLISIAPVYFVNGNHEAALSWDDYRAFTRRLGAMGVEILEDRAVTITRGSQSIQLLGLNDLGFYGGTIRERKKALADTLRLFARSDMFTLVLSHRPDLMEEYTLAPCQLVLCGHAHGGQVRLPLIGGLFSPGQGLFPKYDSGLYRQGETAMYVSRGIGNSNFPLRVNNRPELVLLELKAVPVGA